MKVALVLPGSKAGVSNPRYNQLFPYLLPMSAGYLAAVLEKEGHDVTIYDQVPRRLSNEELVQVLKRDAPELIGFSALTTTVTNILELVKGIRAEMPGTKIVWGNQHATLFADDVLTNGYADFIVRGEGEYTLRAAVAALEAGKSLEGVEGVTWMDNGTIRANPRRELIADLDELPYPSWAGVDVFAERYMYLPLIGVYSTPLPVMASRGCPFKCVFCSQDQWFKNVRLRDPVKVVDEIEERVERYGFKWFGFNDAYFPWTKKIGFQFADELIRRGLHKKVRWISETRVDMVDEELLVRLKEAGLSVLFFGFESGNQKILDGVGKGTTLEQAEAAAKACRKAGITSIGFFMLGLPGDTAETCWETVNFAIKLDVDFAKFAVTIPYPGSQLYEDMKDQIDAKQFEKFNSWYNWASGDEELLGAPEGMTVAELLEIQRAGMFRFYARPTQVVRHLTKGTIPLSLMAYGAFVLGEGLVKNSVARVKQLVKK